jgi:hypothetical protein
MTQGRIGHRPNGHSAPSRHSLRVRHRPRATNGPTGAPTIFDRCQQALTTPMCAPATLPSPVASLRRTNPFAFARSTLPLLCSSLCADPSLSHRAAPLHRAPASPPWTVSSPSNLHPAERQRTPPTGSSCRCRAPHRWQPPPVTVQPGCYSLEHHPCTACLFDHSAAADDLASDLLSAVSSPPDIAAVDNHFGELPLCRSHRCRPAPVPGLPCFGYRATGPGLAGPLAGPDSSSWMELAH